MMDVRTMRRMVDDIQARSLPAAVVTAAARWNGTDLAYVRSSANHVFRFVQDGEPRYLRLAPASERGPEQIRTELDFIAHAARAGIAVARPVPSAGGALIERVDGGGEPCHAVVFEALLGEQLEWPELDEHRWRAWGRTLARLHEASATFPDGAGRPVWRDDVEAALASLPPGETAAAGALRAGLAWLDALPTAEVGLLHGDLELDNLVWKGGECQALDFDSATHGWFALDVAIAVEEVWQEAGAGRDARLGWFFDGYAEVRPLPALVPAAIPRFLTLLTGTKVARVLRAYASSPPGDDPGWLAGMRARHERWLGAKRTALAGDR